MAIDARTEEFQHIVVFDKFALFTNARIDRTTVPDGWYCYGFRGTGNDPGELRFIEESVVVNHSGSILMPEKLALPASGQLDAWDEFGFLDECDMTLREFCEVHDLPYPAEEEEFHIRPARPDEAGLFYAQHPSEDKSLVGRVTFVGDDAQEFTDAEAFLKCIREELPYFPTTGFRFDSPLSGEDSPRRKSHRRCHPLACGRQDRRLAPHNESQWSGSMAVLPECI